MSDDTQNLSNLPVQELIDRLVGSLAMRDWEDSYLERAMSERQMLTHEIISRGENAVASLLTLFKKKDWAVRESAAQMLGIIGSPQAVDILIHILETDDGRGVRISAMEALEKIATPAALVAAQRGRAEFGDDPYGRADLKKPIIKIKKTVDDDKP